MAHSSERFARARSQAGPRQYARDDRACSGCSPELIAAHLESDKMKDRSQQRAALDERKASELRDQFIAVLGHDLRNPLAAIAAGVRLLQSRSDTTSESAAFWRRCRAASCGMSNLINNVLDFARGRLGGGFTLERGSEPMEPVLKQVIEELRAAHPDQQDRERTFCYRASALSVDHNRIAQLFSNLLGNALSHGRLVCPFVVECSHRRTEFRAERHQHRRADPARRRSTELVLHHFPEGRRGQSQQGLGLGLYIASQIAKAHGGTHRCRVVCARDAIHVERFR